MKRAMKPKARISPDAYPGMGQGCKMSIMKAIETVVCEVYNVPDIKMLSLRTRRRDISEPRYVCMYFGRYFQRTYSARGILNKTEISELTTIQISARYDHDHASVICAEHKISDRMSVDKPFKEKIKRMKSIIDNLICPEPNVRSNGSENREQTLLPEMIS